MPHVAVAEQLDLSEEQLQELGDVQLGAGARWITSFLTADKRKSYCLYEAESADAIRAASAAAGLPVDSVIEVTELLDRSAASAD